MKYMSEEVSAKMDVSIEDLTKLFSWEKAYERII